MEYGDTEKNVNVVTEKGSVTSSELVQDNDGIYAKEELEDPDKEDTLQRGLSARQIQMIAVSRPPFVCFVLGLTGRGCSLEAQSVLVLSLAQARLLCVEVRLVFSWVTVLSEWSVTW